MASPTTKGRRASYGQERLWYLHRLDPGNCAYNSPVALRWRGPLDPKLVEQTLHELVARHEPLRTAFELTDGCVYQVASPPAALKLELIDFSGVPKAEREAAARHQVVSEMQRPFDLSRAPLLRAYLFRLDDREHILLLNVHHIAMDGWSAQVLQYELATRYEAFRGGADANLPPLQIQYSDFAEWQRARVENGALESQAAYWKQQLGGELPTLELPADRLRPAIQTFRGAHESRLLSPSLAEQIKALSRRQRISPFMTLLAAFQTLLYRYTGQEDIIVAAPFAGRTRREAEPLVGFLVNTLALRTDLSGNPTFIELLQRVRRTTLDALANQDLPFDKVVEIVQPRRDAGRTPVYQVMFQLRNVPRKPLHVEGVELSVYEFDPGHAKFDLTLDFLERPDGLFCKAEYNLDLFEAPTIQRFLMHFEMLLLGIADRPERRLGDLPLLSAEERNRQLVEWNATRTDYPADVPIQAIFESQASRSPEAVALTAQGTQLTYAQLNARANKLAHYLRRLGAGPETMVGVGLNRSPELVIALLAILKADGAYVPLDPSYPAERLTFMLQDAKIRLLVTEQRLRDTFPANQTVICIDTDWPEIALESDANPAGEATGAHLAYVMYTSGSSGLPKGVAVPHRAVNRLVVNTDYIQLGPADVVAQISNCSFDAATFEIWGALLNGAQLAIISREIALAPRELATELDALRVSALFLTTALFYEVARTVPSAFRNIRTILFGGEAADPRRVAAVLASGPPERLVHVYGPTETTTFASWYQVRDVAPEDVTVPIGRPIANTELYVLDKYMNPVPDGVPGELYIGGPGLARGYLGRPELTAERFVPHPFFGAGDARLYRTGDKVRYLADGNLVFLGRFDDQVKIRGWRIEPGEVERALAGHPGIRDAIVVVREDEPGEKRLVAYFVARDPSSCDGAEARAFLQQKLPDYMLPSAFVRIESVPLTPNGKVNRRALPVPGRELDSGRSYTAPNSLLQQEFVAIWEELLRVRPIGITDDFFQLGGHSLLAVQMLDRIRSMTGKAVPVATLFSGATIEHLAKSFLDQNEAPDAQLIALQSSGRQPSLFLVHGDLSGAGIYTMNLARHLGPDQPIYVLNPHATDEQNRLPSFAAMAAENIERILDIQAEGPFYLAGFCNGAVVAYEMARRLREMRKTVAMLVLIAPPSAGAYFRAFTQRFPSLVARQIPEELLAVDPTLDEAGKRRRELINAYVRLTADYIPGPYDGTVTLLLTAEGRYQTLATGDWRQAARTVETQTIPGAHLTCITTHVGDLAMALSQTMRKASAEVVSGETAAGG